MDFGKFLLFQLFCSSFALFYLLTHGLDVGLREGSLLALFFCLVCVDDGLRQRRTFSHDFACVCFFLISHDFACVCFFLLDGRLDGSLAAPEISAVRLQRFRMTHADVPRSFTQIHTTVGSLQVAYNESSFVSFEYESRATGRSVWIDNLIICLNHVSGFGRLYFVFFGGAVTYVRPLSVPPRPASAGA